MIDHTLFPLIVSSSSPSPRKSRLLNSSEACAPGGVSEAVCDSDEDESANTPASAEDDSLRREYVSTNEMDADNEDCSASCAVSDHTLFSLIVSSSSPSTGESRLLTSGGAPVSEGYFISREALFVSAFTINDEASGPDGVSSVETSHVSC